MEDRIISRLISEHRRRRPDWATIFSPPLLSRKVSVNTFFRELFFSQSPSLCTDFYLFTLSDTTCIKEKVT
jgi:hypothetical protein